MAILVALSSCRVDATINVAMKPDGSGVVGITLVADAELVNRVPGLTNDLRFDDAEAAGWVVDGPSATTDGGLRVLITHDFATPEQATALLQSINGANGPLHEVALARAITDDAVTTTVSGTLRVDGGIGAFADPDLLAAVGGTPYSTEIAEAGLVPADAVGVTLRLNVPGKVTTTSGIADGGDLVWTVPIDGTSLDLATTTTESRGGSNVWSIISTALLILLVVWCVAAVGFIAFVAVARRQRATRRSNSPSL